MLQGLRTWALPPMYLSASSEWLLILLSLCSQWLFTPPALLSSSCHYCCHLPPRAESYIGLRVYKSPSASAPGGTDTGALRVKAEPTPWRFGAKWGNGCSGNSFSRWAVRRHLAHSDLKTEHSLGKPNLSRNHLCDGLLYVSTWLGHGSVKHHSRCFFEDVIRWD